MDLGPSFFRLSPAEREVVVAWAELLGTEPEALPPLRSLVEAVAALRIVDAQEGPRERAWAEAGRLLGFSEPDTVRRRVDYWRRKSRGFGENLHAWEEEEAEVSGG